MMFLYDAVSRMTVTVASHIFFLFCCMMWHLERERFFHSLQSDNPRSSTSRHISSWDENLFKEKQEKKKETKKKKHDEYFSHFASQNKSLLTMNCVRCRQNTHRVSRLKK